MTANYYRSDIIVHILSMKKLRLGSKVIPLRLYNWKALYFKCLHLCEAFSDPSFSSCPRDNWTEWNWPESPLFSREPSRLLSLPGSILIPRPPHLECVLLRGTSCLPLSPRTPEQFTFWGGMSTCRDSRLGVSISPMSVFKTRLGPGPSHPMN